MMKKYYGLLFFLLLIHVTAFSKKKLNVETPNDSISYSVGISMGESLLKTGIGEINQKLFFAALKATIDGKTTLWNSEQADAILMNFLQEKKKLLAQENLEKGNKFLEENGKREEVHTSSTGLQYEVLTMTEGERPTIESRVKCLYVGKHLDGTVFDASEDSDNPMEINVKQLVSGWIEGLQMMTLGSKWRFYIPPELGYGEQGAGSSIGPNETLIFEVELLEILK